jgi:hypothetical protein
MFHEIVGAAGATTSFCGGARETRVAHTKKLKRRTQYTMTFFLTDLLTATELISRKEIAEMKKF